MECRFGRGPVLKSLRPSWRVRLCGQGHTLTKPARGYPAIPELY
jgi:hypothetical protein